jgi:beta-glucosidase
MPQLASYRHLVGLVRSGACKESIIDRAVRRVLRAKFALKLFDEPYVDASEAERTVASAQHVATGTTGRRLGDHAAQERRQHLAVRRRENADDRDHRSARNFAERGNYSGTPSSSVTAVQAVRERLGAGGRVIYAKACVSSSKRNSDRTSRPARRPWRWSSHHGRHDQQRLIREAVDSAKQADAVVLMLGATSRMMNERGAATTATTAISSCAVFRTSWRKPFARQGKPVS